MVEIFVGSSRRVYMSKCTNQDVTLVDIDSREKIELDHIPAVAMPSINGYIYKGNPTKKLFNKIKRIID